MRGRRRLDEQRPDHPLRRAPVLFCVANPHLAPLRPRRGQRREHLRPHPVLRLVRQPVRHLHHRLLHRPRQGGGQLLVRGLGERVGAVGVAPHQPRADDHRHRLRDGEVHGWQEVAFDQGPPRALLDERHLVFAFQGNQIALGLALRDLHLLRDLGRRQAPRLGLEERQLAHQPDQPVVLLEVVSRHGGPHYVTA